MKIGIDYAGNLCLLDEYGNAIETIASYDTKYCSVTTNYYEWARILDGTAEKEAAEIAALHETNRLENRIIELENQLQDFTKLMEFAKTKKGRVELMQLMIELENKDK